MEKVLTSALVALLMTATALALSLHRIKEDVLAAYSKEDFSEMMSMLAIHDTHAVKEMVDHGKVVGLRKGSEVYLESIDLIARIAQVRPKGSTTAVWIQSDFVD
jgi:hypothetical protein